MEKTIHSRVAAIDLGSNGLRIQIFERDNGSMRVVETLRKPVRLGHDVFHHGRILDDDFEAALEAAREFRKLIDHHKASRVSAVATSAIREASNGAAFVDRVLRETDIEIQVIDGSEEARLIITALLEQMKLEGMVAMHIEVGGGSVEVSLIENGDIQFSLTHKLGAVRLLQLLDCCYDSQERFNETIGQYIDITHKRIRNSVGKKKIDRLIATGGNIDSVVWLLEQTGWAQVDRSDGLIRIPRDSLDRVYSELSLYSFKERVEKLQLRPDRADVIMPAIQVYASFAKMAKTDWIYTPGSGVREGLALELFRQEEKSHINHKHRQLISAVMALGEKYEFDRTHAESVAAYAVQIFDTLQDINGSNERERLLLEVAALLHDVGYFIGISRHHKHSYYVISESDIVGLSQRDRLIVANIARYHRKAFPKEQHENFRVLPPKEKKLILKLAAILRVADAMDREHLAMKMDLKFRVAGNKLLITPPPNKDRSITRWAMVSKAELFNEVFGYKAEVE